MKVINLGLPKTGTTTLGLALTRAGMNVADHKIRHRQTDDIYLKGTFVGRKLYDGYYECGDPLAKLTSFDALSEISVLRKGLSLWPQMDFGVIDAIRRLHPDVRFVASRREPRALSGSMMRWSDLGTSRLPRAAIPGLPPGYGDTTLQQVQWIKAHYAHLEMLFDGSDRFLAYDIEDEGAPDRIGAFLGVKLPWWGRANANLNLPAREAG